MLFTCVIPVLNQRRFILEALSSLDAQHADDLEVIVVDGGSTDGTIELLKSFHFTKSSYSWISEKDDGQSAALNKGFARAKGEWLFWLNADDVLLPNAINRVRETFVKNSAMQWIAGNMVFIDENRRVKRCVRSRGWKAEFLNLQVQVYGPSAFFKKELFAAVGGFDESLRYAMDIDLWQRFKAKGVWFQKCSDYFWGFRLHDQSLTHGREANKDGMRAEDAILAKRYNLTDSVLAKFFARAIRFLDGSYFFAMMDTLRMKGKIL